MPRGLHRGLHRPGRVATGLALWLGLIAPARAQDEPPPADETGTRALEERIGALERALDEERRRQAELERQLADRAEIRERLDRLIGQLRALRNEQAAQREAEQAQRRQEAIARVEAAERRDRAIALLQDADAALYAGSDDVGDALDTAADLLEGPPQQSVDEARAALGRSDLSVARAQVERALSLPGAL